MSGKKRVGLLLLIACCPPLALAESTTWSLGGHAKGYLQLQQFPSNSVFHAQRGSQSRDTTAELRLSAKARSGRWSFSADYQLIANHSDSRSARPSSFAAIAAQGALPNDRRRWFDLTHSLHDSGRSDVLHRLDRLWVGYTTQNTVVRFGRQALSWGNGLFYSPMDIVNPFDPAAIDTEYKAGDDMLYVQHLLGSGHDIEAAWVVRRNPASGDVDSGQQTGAIRYNALVGENEYQILLARSYGDTIVGLGGSRSLGGAVVRADLLISDADRRRAQLVTNTSYSWVWRGKNVIGSLEYFFNGFGLKESEYGVSNVIASPALANRLSRGETFSIGRHYLAAGLSIEISPLWSITPTLFANLEDRSGLLQLASQYSLGDNLTLLGAITTPLGPDGSEFRGIQNSEDNFLSRDAALFAQIAWYF